MPSQYQSTVRGLPLGAVGQTNVQNARRCAFQASWQACRHRNAARSRFTPPPFFGSFNLLDKLLGFGQLHISAGKSLRYMLSEIRGI
jgi:hypothetical protein